MPAFIDITGQEFGRLIVTGYLGSSWWRCRCTCGELKDVRGLELKKGKVRSCGCLHRETCGALNRRYTKEEAALRVKFNTYSKNAIRRGYEFGLTFEEFVAFTEEDCFWCGTEGPNGIDRYDNDLGYTVDNCVAACYLCNRAKNDLSPQEFVDWVDRAYHHIHGE